MVGTTVGRTSAAPPDTVGELAAVPASSAARQTCPLEPSAASPQSNI